MKITNSIYLRDTEMEYQYGALKVYVGYPRKNFIKDYVIMHNKDFFEPLSLRVDIEVFVQKLHDLSTIFLLIKGTEVAGLIATYFYAPETKRGYITLTHTKERFRGQHVARHLLDAVRAYAKGKGFKFIDLGVYKENSSAYNLYLHTGFKVLSDNGIRCEMRLII